VIAHSLNLPVMPSGIFSLAEVTPKIEQYRGRSFIITHQTSFFTGYAAWRLQSKSSQCTFFTKLAHVLFKLITKPCNVHALR
jgi:hypothetical protein